MSSSLRLRMSNFVLPVILTAAVVQGWSLYALHESIDTARWPASDPRWLLALYATVLFVPLTLQLLAQHAKQRTLWMLLGCVAVMFFYFAWHAGASVLDRPTQHFVSSGNWFPLTFVLVVLWLLLMPFVQARLIGGRWRAGYSLLFSTAWNNKLVLAEAMLFTGLFWLLLFLWQKLFSMLGIHFFKELFEEPIFVYPVTSIVFGIALHLIGSIEKLTSVVLEQLLNVLKWLALIAALILALFTVALVFKLPGMISTGERAIGAAWLLWLVAVTVLLVNAAYRDGGVDRPYPGGIAFMLRLIVPLLVVIALTAVYALCLRIDEYGFTVERVWACIVAGAALFYAVGYSIAARTKAPWMGGIATVNVATALFLVAAVALALTPLLSPYRIAANSQFELAKITPAISGSMQRRYDTPMHYLRFNAGKYGTQRLEELARIEDHPRASEIREDAAAMIAQGARFSTPLPTDVKQWLSEMAFYPSGRTLDANLTQRLDADLGNEALAWAFPRSEGPLVGVFLDLNEDGSEEFVLVTASNATVYEHNQDEWRRVARFARGNHLENRDLLAQLAKGNVAAQNPAWKELKIGPYIYRFVRDGD